MNVGRAPGGARWEYPRLGWNYRPSEYLAAILQVRLELLEAQTDLRNRNAVYLSNALETIEGITPPTTRVMGYQNTGITSTACSTILKASVANRDRNLSTRYLPKAFRVSIGYRITAFAGARNGIRPRRNIPTSSDRCLVQMRHSSVNRACGSSKTFSSVRKRIWTRL